MKSIYPLLIMMLIWTGGRSQTQYRVVAFARYGADTTIPTVDSGGYKYANGNGGEIYCGLNEFNEDFPFVYLPVYDFETGYNGLIKSDSSWETRANDTDVSVQFFDASGNVTYALCLMYSDGVWGKYVSSGYSYDTGNNLVQKMDTTWLARGFVYTSQFNYLYDAGNRLVQQTSLYNTTDSTGPNEGTRTTYSYDASGRVTTVEDYAWNMKLNAFNSVAEDSEGFKYNGSVPDSFEVVVPPASVGDVGVYYFSPASDSMVLNLYGYDNYCRVINTYGSDHIKTSSTKLLLDPTFSWIYPYKYEWSYNANNQVTCQRNYTLDTSSGTWVFTSLVRFYYEAYTPEVPFGINNLTIFPSPAKGAITVKLEWATAQPFTCAIFDAAGHLVTEWDVPATQKYEHAITLPYMASGNYFFRAAAGKQKLVKQFVVLN